MLVLWNKIQTHLKKKKEKKKVKKYTVYEYNMHVFHRNKWCSF